MRFVRQGVIDFTFFSSVFVLNPLKEADNGVCLTPEWRGNTWCHDMGMRYIDNPNTIEGLHEFRRTLFGPTTTIWFQAGSEEWFKLIEAITVHRNSSLGADFEA